jgi:toxoflavin biosynthesis protein ToxC
MHKGPITSVLPSADGKKVYTAGYDRCIYQWDPQTGESSLLGTHKHLVNALALSEKGDLLASSSSDYTIHIYDLKENILSRVLLGHSDDVEAISFACHDEFLVSTSRDKRCLVWDVKTGAIIREFHGHSKDVLALWIMDDLAFTTGDDGRALVWEIRTGKLVGEIGPFDCELDTVGGNINKKIFAIGADDGYVFILDAVSLKVNLKIHAHKQGVKKVVFSPSGTYLLTAGYDHKIKIWMTDTGELVQELTPYQYQWERSIAWSPNEKSILGASFGKCYCEWSIEDGKLKGSNIELATPSINDLAVTDQEDIVTASDDGIFRVNGVEIAKSSGILTNGVGASRDGNFLVWGDHSGQISIIDRCNQTKKEIQLNTGPVNNVFYNRYDQRFYVGTYGGYIHIIDPVQGIEEKAWKAHSGAVKAVQSDYQVIVSVSADGSIHLFDKKNNEKAIPYFGPAAIVNDVFLDSERNRFVVVSRDKIVRMFDLNTGKILGQHNMHRYSVKSVTITEDGRIVSGDYWGYCVIWDRDQNEVSSPLRIAQNGISALRTINNKVYASSYDGGVYKINLDNKKAEEIVRLFQQITPAISSV